MTSSTFTVQQATVDDFLTGHRIAVVGASADPKNFGNTIYRELKSHGYEPVAVHPFDGMVEGDTAYTDLEAVPGDIDGVIVMVAGDQSAAIVDQSAARGVTKVWLFRGLGGDGAASDAAVRRCHDLDLQVVAGACPLMFLEPAGWVHRLHRSARRHNHSLDVRPAP